jgi:hypothetical protein
VPVSRPLASRKVVLVVLPPPLGLLVGVPMIRPEASRVVELTMPFEDFWCWMVWTTRPEASLTVGVRKRLRKGVRRHGKMVLGTNKAVSTVGTSLAVWRYARSGAINWRLARWVLVLSFGGATVGAKLSRYQSRETMAVLLLLLVIVPLVLILSLRKQEPPDTALHTNAPFLGCWNGPDRGSLRRVFRSGHRKLPDLRLGEFPAPLITVGERHGPRDQPRLRFPGPFCSLPRSFRFTCRSRQWQQRVH